MENVPYGVRMLQKLTDGFCATLVVNRQAWYRNSVLILTYIAYCFYNLSRKPISVVKTVLHQNCSRLQTPAGVSPNNDTWCSWAPFDGADASELLGEVDSAYLFSYAIAMFGAGIVADRVDLRRFLTIGMVLSGWFCCMLGLAKTFDVHSFAYFVVVQVAVGVCQATGWPAIIAILRYWNGKSNRGLIYGIWHSQSSVGHILGTVIAAHFLETNWALSFVWPGIIMMLGGLLMYLFLPVKPTDVGCSIVEDLEESHEEEQSHENGSLLRSGNSHAEERPISFVSALMIPGVVEFSLSILFVRVVHSTFLFWLPLYLDSTTDLGAKFSSDLSTLFDVGGIGGGVLAGALSDCSGMPAFTCFVLLAVSIPVLFVYEQCGSFDMGLNSFLLILVGVLAIGPPTLVVTAVTADLGTHPTLDRNSKAMGTVASIIDGMACIGAAIGPLVVGFISEYGWRPVFYMLMASNFLAMLFLIRLIKEEFVARKRFK